ncbi:WXG100 family type VII secretion target [Saccharopolyspora hirsuta]|uniref:ESAT-6-like protein n=1 Tax=Saccharopolyspora hirsuta TaxID=1837 RepID=A0A5M7BSA1_SACHI|nr:WXG100 family type VII secretion target [Saccharopolyspora hirsuta]KAA5830114.1 WXG100 family type VII secretion target [Saccharopolyspora hirsuta]MBF6507435.1 WXG100 family type VII secretion target [Nocardia farcinica]
MSDYRFDFNIAEATLQDMHQVNTHVRQALDQMQAAVESSTADWTGSAKQAYAEAKAEWNKQAAMMPEHLKEAQRRLGSIAEGYGTTEVRATQSWRDFG